MLAYLDVGLGIYALLLLRPSRALRQARYLLRRHSLLVVYVAVLIAALLWPAIVLFWLLGVHRD